MKVTNTILTVSALATIALTTTSCHQAGHAHIDGDKISGAISNAVLDLECTEVACTAREDGSLFDKMVHAILDLKRPVEPGCIDDHDDHHGHDHVHVIAPAPVHHDHDHDHAHDEDHADEVPVKVRKKRKNKVRPVVNEPAPIVESEPTIIDVVLNNSEDVIGGIIDSVFRNREGLRDREDLAQNPPGTCSNY